MPKKKIEWGNIPVKGLDDSNLSKFSIKQLTAKENRILASIASGKKRAESGELLKIAIKGGKTQGKKNAENGHCKRIAKSGGDANVKSGHIHNIRHLAIEKCSIPIVQCDKNGKRIKVWKSAVEAARAVGTTPQNISLVLNPNKRNKTAGGFIWKYKK